MNPTDPMNEHLNESESKPKIRLGLASYCWLAAGMLTIAVFFKMPYGYYQLMRFVVCGVAGFCAYKAYEGRKQPWLFLAGFVALLFNPFVPIRFDRDTWRVLDFITAILMPIMGYQSRER